MRKISNNANLLQLIFDSIWNVGENVYRLLTKKKKVKKDPLDIFFEKVRLCNRDEEYPKVVHIANNKEGNVYKVYCPIGLGKGDFQKYEDALEIYLGKKISIETSNGFIYIKE